jgi:hypothetical protein
MSEWLISQYEHNHFQRGSGRPCRKVQRAAPARCIKQILLSGLACSLLTVIATAGTLPEYTAAGAGKHIGETARVIGKVGCIDADASSTWHCLSLEGCARTFGIIVPDARAGLELKAILLASRHSIAHDLVLPPL